MPFLDFSPLEELVTISGCPEGQQISLGVIVTIRFALAPDTELSVRPLLPAQNALVTGGEVANEVQQWNIAPESPGEVRVEFNITGDKLGARVDRTFTCTFTAVVLMGETPLPDVSMDETPGPLFDPPFDVTGCPEGQDVPVGSEFTITFTRKLDREGFERQLLPPVAANVILNGIDNDPFGFSFTYRVVSEGTVRIEILFTNDIGLEFPFVCAFNAVAPEFLVPDGVASLLARFEAEDNVALASRVVDTAVRNSAKEDKVAPAVPEAGQEINLTGSTRKGLSADKVAQTLGNTDFPCGAGEFGFTVCPDSDLALSPQAGEWLFVFSVFDAPIPLDDPDRFYQYAFVFDRNASILDNFSAAAEFPNDYFQGTDTWFSAEYSPLTGWRLVVTDAILGGQTPVSSAARIIIRDNVVLLVVPAGEFPIPNPPYRATAFCHDGGFGLDGGFWSGDLEPKVDQPLQAFE